MRAVIIDDDAEFIGMLAEKLAVWCHEAGVSMEISDITILDSLEHMSDVRRMLKYTKGYDVYFVDIVMPVLSGFDLVEEIRSMHPEAEFVFISAYESYMPEAFYSRPTAFIRKSHLEEDMKRLLKHWRNKGRWTESVIIPCESGGGWTVKPDELVYCMSREHYVEFHFNDGRVILQRVKLKDVETALGDWKFIRTHNRYLVNQSFIVKVTNDSVWVTNFGGDNCKYMLPVSKSRRQGVGEAIGKE